jgi:hypothetical protein
MGFPVKNGREEGDLMTNFAIYLIGVALVVGALAYGAHLLGASPAWIMVGALALIGFGVMAGIVKTRREQ